MPSHSLLRWFGERSDALDEIADAHAQVGGTERGRRFATQQINHAYAVLLSSQFQGFCRDLHSECAEFVVVSSPIHLRTILNTQLNLGRALDKGNPNPGNIGADFGRFAVSFWSEVQSDNSLNQRRQQYLEELNTWRNAIAHQDFDAAKLGGTTILHLTTVRQWRSSLNGLSVSFDNVMYSHLQTLFGTTPW
jgi:RiboL-PSP-HEPN